MSTRKIYLNLFNLYMFKGIHYIYDFTNIQTTNVELYQKKINIILDKIIKESELNQIDKSENLFDGISSPPGFANVRVLDESHISAHSYSEQGILAIDIFTCGNLKNGIKAGELCKKYILENFKDAIIKNEQIINRFPI